MKSKIANIFLFVFLSVFSSCSLLNGEFKEVKKELDDLFSENGTYRYIYDDIDLPSEINGVAIEWSSSNPDILSNDGIVNRDNKDVDVTLKANLKIDEKDKEFEYLVTVNAADENTNYKITFDTQGGTLVNTIKKKANEELTTPNDSVRNGYVFLGWYDSLENDEQFKFTKMPNKNVTLYAKWAKLENNNLKDL